MDDTVHCVGVVGVSGAGVSTSVSIRMSSVVRVSNVKLTTTSTHTLTTNNTSTTTTTISATNAINPTTTMLTGDRASNILLQWLAFIRAAVHLLYRVDSNRYTNTNTTSTSGSNTTLPTPSSWLDNTAESLLVQSVADVTNAQIVKHLQLLSMHELISGDSSNGDSVSGVNGINGMQHELLAVCMKWTVDYTNHTTYNDSGSGKLDIGVFSSSEVAALLDTSRANNSATGGGDCVANIDFSSLATKPSATTASTTTASGVNAAPKWPSIQSTVYGCYPRAGRPGLIALPREYTKLHAMVMAIIAARISSANASASASAKGDSNTTTSTTITSTISTTASTSTIIHNTTVHESLGILGIHDVVGWGRSEENVGRSQVQVYHFCL